MKKWQRLTQYCLECAVIPRQAMPNASAKACAFEGRLMGRIVSIFLLALPLALAALASSAAAQGYPQPYYRDAPPGYQTDANNPNVAVRRPAHQAQQQPFRDADETDDEAPPPQFAPPAIAPQSGTQQPPASGDAGAIRPPGAVGTAPGATPQPVSPSTTAALPPEDQPEQGPPQELPDNLKKQLVDFQTKEPAGTIIIDTPNTYLYLVMGHGKAMRYGIGVGREGFTWSGTERISRMKEWPDWFPPAEMIERQPYLPRMMAGGPGNPLGARALYLGNTLYRIHGTNQPSTIGKTVSSGCIRLLNQDIEDLFSRVQVGTRVVVLPGAMPATTADAGGHAAAPPPSAAGVSPPTINGLTGKPLPPAR
jgi:lipoprotein-anchoring transpeptidase ErfK/SrfK